MPTNFYKQGGNYYRTDTGNKVSNLNELQDLAKAGGKEIQDFNVSIVEPPKSNTSVSIVDPSKLMQPKISASLEVKPKNEVSNISNQVKALNAAGLNEAYARIQKGTANEADKANVKYAQGKGWSPSAQILYNDMLNAPAKIISQISETRIQPPTPTTTITPRISAVSPEVRTLQQSLADIQSKIASKQTEIEQYNLGTTSSTLGLEGQGRGITSGLVRGQQEKLQRQRELGKMTKQTELAGLQREEAGLISRLATAKEEVAPITAGNEIIRYNPNTGQYETIYRGTKDVSPIKVGAGETIIDPTTGEIIYEAPTSITEADRLDIEKKQLEIDKLKRDIESSTSDIDRQLKQAELDAKLKELSGAETASPYQVERSYRTIQSINELIPQISAGTTGWGAFFAGKLPETQARYFAGQLNTLKSNIAFNELTAMREASKTGGALGQVSDREGRLLESALGSLDQLQNGEQLQVQLIKIAESIKRWQDAVSQYGGGEGEDYSW